MVSGMFNPARPTTSFNATLMRQMALRYCVRSSEQGFCNYRQEVTGGRILSILGDDVFHALLPLDGELLPGLSSPVRDGSVLQVPIFSDRPYQ